ncbi:MAG: response regulator [Verrucomicrobiota bacterium]|nr:response regulator [Verrucomicrobiota bacterium]
MLDHEDLKWIATTCTELNSILQQVARYSDLARRHKGAHNYIDLLGERVELATKTAQALFDRVTSKILAKTTGKRATAPAPPHTPFTVLPPPMRTVPAGVASVITPVASGEKPKLKSARNSSAPVAIPADIKVKNGKGNRELLLLIEDEVEVAELASEMLADEGYKVILAHDGFDALKIYERLGKQIGLVILDFFLPVMDGDAVFDELRTLNPDVNVVLSSGFAEQSKISSMLAQGLSGFIPKPYSREKLLAQVRSTLDAARQT